MGDISEYGGLIFIGTFIILLSVLLISVPADLFIASVDAPTIDYSEFDPHGLVAYNTTYEMAQADIPIGAYGKYYLDWGKSLFGHDMRMWYQTSPTKKIWNEHAYTFLGLYTGGHRMDWKNEAGFNRGEYLELTELELDYSNTTGGGIYKIECIHFFMKCFVTYNASAYDSPTLAFDDKGLYFIFGIDWDQKGTSYDAWSLITGVLFFSLPGDLGANIWVYALVSIPLWMAALYMAFIFVLRILGAIFGGGGS